MPIGFNMYMGGQSPLAFPPTPSPPTPSTDTALTCALERAQIAESEVTRLAAALSTSQKALDDEKLQVEARVAQIVDEQREQVEKDLKEKSMAAINEKVRKAMAAVEKEKSGMQRSFDEKVKKIEEKYTRRLEELEKDSGEKVREKLRRVEAAYLALSREKASGTARIRAMRQKFDADNIHAELARLRHENSQLGARNTELQQAAGMNRRDVAYLRDGEWHVLGSNAPVKKIIPLRNDSSAQSPLTARTCEFLRRILEEGEVSVRSMPTVHALYMAMLFGEDAVDEAHLISSAAVKNSIELLGIVDDDAEKAANREMSSFYSIAADGGNEDREMELLAVGRFDAGWDAPQSSALAATDLFANQSAANGMSTIVAAVEYFDFCPWLCSGLCTDHTGHAVNEAEGAQRTLLERAPPEICAPRRSDTIYCSIHAKQLEENAGLEAMWPGDRMVGALRILWELVGKGADGSRRNEYRDRWITDCKFPAYLWDDTLGRMSEPTSSKWQVMHGLCETLIPLFEPVQDSTFTPACTPTYLEKFLDVCARMYAGTTDELRTVRALHSSAKKARDCL